jgi:hypothetical protein
VLKITSIIWGEKKQDFGGSGLAYQFEVCMSHLGVSPPSIVLFGCFSHLLFVTVSATRASFPI